MLVETRIEGRILLIEMASPPVNCLSWELRKQLHAAFTAAALDEHIDAVILYGSGKYFCAGGDLRELGTPAASAKPRLSADVLRAVEECGKPVIAAIHGAAIGGGFELALACHHRVALDNTRLAFPEIEHGIMPLSATLRLPRIWGIARTLDMLLHSHARTAGDFADSAVFDLIAHHAEHREIVPIAIEFARAITRADRGALDSLLIRNRTPCDDDPRAALADALAAYKTTRLTPAQTAVIEAMRIGVETPDFDAALAHSERIYDALASATARDAMTSDRVASLQASKRT